MQPKSGEFLSEFISLILTQGANCDIMMPEMPDLSKIGTDILKKGQERPL
jgi:hypothetical protein